MKGGPRLPPERRLSEILPVRVTPDEYDAAYKAASARRMKLSDFLREALRAAINRKH